MKIKIKKNLTTLIVTFLSFFVMQYAFAEETIGTISGNLFDVALGVKAIVRAMFIIAGVALMLGGIFQYNKYKKNPVETRLSTAIVIFFLGVLVLVIAFIPMQSLTG